eukprot:scaffold129082_cov17-Prasinocladus_malaysianus.AAC.1
MVVAAMKLKKQKGSSIHSRPKAQRAEQIGAKAEVTAKVRIVEQDRSVAPIYPKCILACLLIYAL